MQAHRTRSFLWLGFMTTMLSPAIAIAQEDGAAPKAHEHPPAPSGKYSAACAQGNAKYAAHDFPAAVALYRSAIDLEPKNPLGHYLLGEVQLASGNVAEAESAWGRALLESGGKDPTMHARILFVIADLKERQWRWNEAKAAWQIYLDWTSSFASAAAFPDSARSRRQVIDSMVQQDKAYDVVRERIAETKDGGVFN